ncbi:retrotransposon protein, putative, ty1-copia subclass [Tanacetum coccineum]
MAIQGGRIQEANKKSLNAKGKGKGKGKGKDKSYIPKPKNLKPSAKEHPTKDDACHHYKEVGHCKRNCPAYLAELIKKKKQVGTANSSDIFVIELFSFPTKSWVYDTSCGTHICNTKHGLRGVRKLKQVEAIGSFDFTLHLQTRQSERRNRTLLDMVRSMMNLTTLPLSFWDYALEIATRILNMVPTKKVDKTPYELGYGKVPNLSYLKVWGCEALVKRDTPDKLQQRFVKCIFIGYPKEIMGYYFYFPRENKIDVARYVEFFEKNLLSQEVNERAGELEEIQDEDTSPSKNTSEIPMEVEGFEPPHEEEALVRSYNVRFESNKWLDAMNAEMQSMKDNQVWRLVDLPPDCKIVGSKWIFKKKTDMDGNVHTYKACLVAKGFTQLYGVDYEETFSPVADIRAIRILIAIAAFYDYEIWQMDVKTAFLNGYLDEDIYMVRPEGFIDPKHPRKVCKLQRSIYGLKQASRSWSKRFDKEIKRMDNSKRGYIPMQEGLDLNKIQGASTPGEVKRMQNVPYDLVVGSIMYAERIFKKRRKNKAKTTKPDSKWKSRKRQVKVQAQA